MHYPFQREVQSTVKKSVFEERSFGEAMPLLEPLQYTLQLLTNCVAKQYAELHGAPNPVR